MSRPFSLSAILIGILAAFVGFASSFAVVLQGLRAVGASEAEAASGLMAASIAMGLAGMWLAWRTRMPVAVAWSTPGAALLALSGAPVGGFAEAVGAFLVCGVLIVVSGLMRPFGRLVAAIPAPLAAAMLAGVLLPLCLAPFRAVAFDPWLGLPILVAWIIGLRIHRLAAVPLALAAFVAVLLLGVPFPEGWADGILAAAWPQPVLTVPIFTLQSLLGIALPLFIVTMASQNVPGLAVLRANGYAPDQGPLLTATGVFSLLGAPFGSHAVNLAAITAAMMASEEAGPDPKARWGAAFVNGIVYVLFGLTAGATVSFVALAPAVLIEEIAGLALVFAFMAAVTGAFADDRLRPAAVVTFLASASGITLGGISGAFWGLLAGILIAWAWPKPAAP